MRILRFDPYGSLEVNSFSGNPKQLDYSLGEKISSEISRNEALRLALLVIADQEQEQRQKRHRFKILQQKQKKILLSQLRHFRLDFRTLRREDESEDAAEKRNVAFEVPGKKKVVKMTPAASRAIAHAAEAWVIARNKGVLDMAVSLFLAKDENN